MMNAATATSQETTKNEAPGKNIGWKLLISPQRFTMKNNRDSGIHHSLVSKLSRGPIHGEALLDYSIPDIISSGFLSKAPFG